MNTTSKIDIFLSKQIFLGQVAKFKIYSSVLSLAILLVFLVIFVIAYGVVVGLLIVLDAYLILCLAELIYFCIRKLRGAKATKLTINGFIFYTTFKDTQSTLNWQNMALAVKITFLFLAAFLHAMFYQRINWLDTCYIEPGNVATVIGYILLTIGIWHILPIGSLPGWELISNLITARAGKTFQIKKSYIVLPYILIISVIWITFSFLYPVLVPYSPTLYCKNSAIFLLVIYLTVGFAPPVHAIIMLSYAPVQVNSPQLARALTEGAELLKQGDFEIARKIFSETLENFPDRADVLYYTARTEYEFKNYPLVIQHLTRLLELEPKTPQVNLFLGKVYYHTKEYETALKSYNREKEISPQFFPVYDNLAEVYNKLKLYPEMLENSRLALKFATTPAERVYAHISIGYSFIREKGFAQAIEHYNIILSGQYEDKNSFAIATNNRGFCYLHLGQVENARNDFLESAKLQTDSGKWNLISLDLALNKTTSARQAFIQQAKEFPVVQTNSFSSELAKIAADLLEAVANNTSKDLNLLIQRLEDLPEQDLESDRYYWLSQVYKALDETEKSNHFKQKALEALLPPVLMEDVV